MWSRSCAPAVCAPTPTLVGVLPPRAAPCAAGFALAGGGYVLGSALRAARRDDAACPPLRCAARNGPCRAWCGSLCPFPPSPPLHAVRRANGRPAGRCARPLSRRTASALPRGGYRPRSSLAVRGAGSGGALRLTPTAADPPRPKTCMLGTPPHEPVDVTVSDDPQQPMAFSPLAAKQRCHAGRLCTSMASPQPSGVALRASQWAIGGQDPR